MKYKLVKGVLFAMLSITLACKKDKVTDPTDLEIIAPTPIGVVNGPKTTKEIGPNGGLIETAEGISISIPDGALDKNTVITVEPISTTNPAGIGQSFRLLPHGIKFTKPIEMTFSFAAVASSIPLIEGLTVSYQDDQGIWRVEGNTRTNPTDQTITVVTDHFSDWVPMKWLDLVPGNAQLEVGKSLTLKAVRYIQVEDDDFLIVPLVPSKVKDRPVIRPVALAQKHIVKWELGGPGELKANGNTATLTAPKSVASGNGAAVSLQVKSPGVTKRLLVSNITYLSDEYLLVSFNGGEWKSYYGALTNIQQKYNAITGMVNPGDEFVPLAIIWNTGEGNHPWTAIHEPNKFVEFQYAYSTKDHLSHLYENSKEDWVPSGGSLNIPKINKDGYTEGTFNLSSAGRWVDGEYAGKLTISGKFKLKFHQF
ncbi:hypothetical protein [Sphingobacterium thalpophilum]|uniref:ZU5 domain-containing protein n=1 Tax=Sphingobacterium thalpophilum TaxID=259 RepID=A0A4U9VBU0_9SPHI|nr:hypothetical protein [Sphingobacterium thalpophilum]VTR43503.1 Uncharacterised protein [Sphingobacterium thalpophilum]